MKQFCKIMGIATIVFGVISSIVTAVAFGTSIKIDYYFGPEKVRNWPLTIILFIAVLFYFLIFSAILFGISQALENHEYLASKLGTLESNTSKSEDTPGWKCPKCGKNNPNYTGTCSCGYSKF